MIHHKCYYSNRHSREGGNPVGEPKTFLNGWIPAFAGMTQFCANGLFKMNSNCSLDSNPSQPPLIRGGAGFALPLTRGSWRGFWSNGLSGMNSTLEIVLCALALTASAPANADELGRLFFTPEQRAQLDYSHARESLSDNNDRALTLNGIVQKHGGKRTAWINGVPQTVGLSDERSPESVPVPLPGQNKSVKLKVGQRMLLSPSASPGSTPLDTSTPDTPMK